MPRITVGTTLRISPEPPEKGKSRFHLPGENEELSTFET